MADNNQYEEIAWEVKTVLDKRIDPVTGNVEYLLDWKKWDGPPTWEPEENCDCKSLINKFEKNLEKQANTGQSSSIATNQTSSRSQTPNTPKQLKRTPNQKQNSTQSKTNVNRRQSQRVISNRKANASFAGPRSGTPPLVEIESSCSEAEEVTDRFNELFTERRLRLKEIVGAVNPGDGETLLIVKWHGIDSLEKVPLQVLRRFYCQDIVDFLLPKIKWQS